MAATAAAGAPGATRSQRYRSPSALSSAENESRRPAETPFSIARLISAIGAEFPSSQTRAKSTQRRAAAAVAAAVAAPEAEAF